MSAYTDLFQQLADIETQLRAIRRAGHADLQDENELGALASVAQRVADRAGSLASGLRIASEDFFLDQNEDQPVKCPAPNTCIWYQKGHPRDRHYVCNHGEHYYGGHPNGYCDQGAVDDEHWDQDLSLLHTGQLDAYAHALQLIKDDDL